MRVELFPQAGYVFPGRRRAWYLRLVAENGETLATSEAYATRWGVRRAAAKNFPGLPVEELAA